MTTLWQRVPPTVAEWLALSPRNNGYWWTREYLDNPEISDQPVAHCHIVRVYLFNNQLLAIGTTVQREFEINNPPAHYEWAPAFIPP